jgi:hypothetical protein
MDGFFLQKLKGRGDHKIAILDLSRASAHGPSIDDRIRNALVEMRITELNIFIFDRVQDNISKDL